MICRFLFVAFFLILLQVTTHAAPNDIRSVTWEKITRTEPRPGYDVEAELARIQHDWKRQGAVVDVPSMRRSLEQTRDGSSQRELQTWSTDGKAIRKDFSYGDTVALPQPAPLIPLVKGYTMERNGLYVQVTTYSKPNTVRDADVNRLPEEAMLRNDEQGNTLRSLLLGTSPKRFLTSPLVVSANLAPEGTVLTLKKKIPFRLYGKPIWIPRPIRLLISRDGERLLQIEELGHQDELSWKTTTTEGWSQIKSGLWLPGRIQVVSYERSANGKRRVFQTETYRRIRTAVGEAVNVAPLKGPFFSGKTHVSDNRFDPEFPDIYSADREPLTESEAERRYAKRRRENVLSALLPQLLGVLVIGGLVIGIFLKIRRGDE